MKGKNEKALISILRDHGLHATFQRLAIYEALISTHEHPTAETIYQQIKKRFPIVSLGTVYKTLETFCEVGLIHKVNPLTGVARYDAITGHHHHLVCMKCHSIEDAESIVEEPRLSEQNGFRVLRQQVFFHGYCPSCRESISG